MMQELKDRLTTQPSNQLTAPMLRRLLWGVAVLVWLPFAAIPAIAAIAPSTTAAIEAPLNIQPVLMGLAVVISSLAGATALLMRIDRELSASPDKPLPHPWIMSTSHMLGAWLAGTAAFIISRQLSWDVWATLGFVLSASFASAKFLEALYEKYMPSRLAPPELTKPDPT